jgi:hypothetical protein
MPKKIPAKPFLFIESMGCNEPSDCIERDDTFFADHLREAFLRAAFFQ